MQQSHIRNFSIIAHIDHGKSTLADRFIQRCGGLDDREMSAQVLDSMDLERERGITIKAQSVSLEYTSKDDQVYLLNFIDTPGHVDFSYEVSRSLAACEGALLVVDASQGVEAQSVANCYTAIEQDLEVIPVLNKIDLPAAEPERVVDEIEEIIGLEAHDAVLCSAKTGVGIDELLEMLVERVPPPEGSPDDPLQALIIDSWFDNFVGVISLIRIVSGSIKKRDKIKIVSTGRSFQTDSVGVFTPKRTEMPELSTGQVGYIIAGIKEIDAARVGDTITMENNPCEEPLDGFKEVQPRVFAGLYPSSSDDYESFRDALQKLRLNDAALAYEPETSEALGFGFRCGFLGMLHMEIVQERLEREYNLDLITTAPTVIYELLDTSGNISYIHNPSQLLPPNELEEVREPIIQANILVPNEYLGDVITLCVEKRGVQKNTFDYAFLRFQAADLVKVDILINGDQVDALAVIVHRDRSQSRGRELSEKMKELIPRQMFDVAVQAAIGNHIIARTNVKALRKNVTAKCYGGDITRKKKLLEKQKAGKRRMKQIGRVEIPQEAFLAVLQVDNKS